MILKNRTIRFNRLDKVDDIEEGNAESYGIRFCQYVFVSCWTDNPEENIPLWKMYSGDFGGIRISMEQEMFKEYLIQNLDFGGLKSHGSMISRIPADDLTKSEYFVFPYLDYKNKLFFRRIKYVEDVSTYTKDFIQISNIKGERGDVSMNLNTFGTYKNKRWEFQNEVRFVIYVLPFNPLKECANPDISTIFINSISNNSLPISHYDMHLKNEAFDNMEITLSPSATEAENLIVHALIEKYAPNVKISNSNLGKLIRFK